MTRNEIFETASEYGVKIVKAQSQADNSRVAIHLLNPSLGEVEEALDRAISNSFPAIVLHSAETWPN